MCIWKQGKPLVVFTLDEIVKSMEAVTFTLVAKFTGPRPSVDQVRAVITQTWGLSDAVFVGVLNANHLLLRFMNDDDFVKGWSREVYSIKGILFRVFPWTPLFKPGMESPICPVWVQLPLLPCNLFDVDFLASIVTAIGKYVTADHATLMRTRPGLARVCVEVDLTKCLPQEIVIGMGSSHSFVQKVVYEKVPFFCSKCQVRGHKDADCVGNPLLRSPFELVSGNGEVVHKGDRGSDTLETTGVAAKDSLFSKELTSRALEKKKSVAKKFRSQKKLKESTREWVSRTFYANVRLKKKRKLQWAPKKVVRTAMKVGYVNGMEGEGFVSATSGIMTDLVKEATVADAVTSPVTEHVNDPMVAGCVTSGIGCSVEVGVMVACNKDGVAENEIRSAGADDVGVVCGIVAADVGDIAKNDSFAVVDMANAESVADVSADITVTTLVDLTADNMALVAKVDDSANVLEANADSSCEVPIMTVQMLDGCDVSGAIVLQGNDKGGVTRSEEGAINVGDGLFSDAAGDVVDVANSFGVVHGIFSGNDQIEVKVVNKVDEGSEPVLLAADDGEVLLSSLVYGKNVRKKRNNAKKQGVRIATSSEQRRCNLPTQQELLEDVARRLQQQDLPIPPPSSPLLDDIKRIRILMQQQGLPDMIE